MDGNALRKAVEWTIMSRRSIRFRPTPVPRETLESILGMGGSLASGVNTQPWRVHVVTEQVRTVFCAAIQRVDGDSTLDETRTNEWNYYPREWISPYIEGDWNRKRRQGTNAGTIQR
jgi:nitroreductase